MTAYVTRHNLSVTAIVAALLVLTPAASAAVITFTQAGVGSGTLNGVPFPASSFVIWSVGDTANVGWFEDGWYLDHNSSSITIAGLGTVGLVSPTETFVNNTNQIVGYTRADTYYDLYDGPTNPAFASWDMLTPIGPIYGTAQLLQWATFPVVTTGGVLVFNDGAAPTVFTAVIPEPASFVACGLASLLARRRR
jgi:hypothetical protein